MYYSKSNTNNNINIIQLKTRDLQNTQNEKNYSNNR